MSWMNLDHWKSIVGIMVVGIPGLYGGWNWHDSRYAHQSIVEQDFDDLRRDLALVDMRGGQKIQSDRIYQIRQRMWQLEDRHGHDRTQWPASAAEEYRQLEIDLDDARHKLERIEKRYEEMESMQQMRPNY